VAQPPQWFTSTWLFTSQPLLTLPSQLRKPAKQAIWHAEPTHEGVPLVLEHTVAQPPQCEASLVRFTSQPSFAWPLQSAKPLAQVATPHSPAVQLGEACGTLQASPQPLQLLGR